MKINEFKMPDDEMYNETDINAVINQALNGEWEAVSVDQLLTQLNQLAGGIHESTT